MSRFLQDNTTDPNIGGTLGALHFQHAALKFCLQKLLTCCLHCTWAVEAAQTHTVEQSWHDMVNTLHTWATWTVFNFWYTKDSPMTQRIHQDCFTSGAQRTHQDCSTSGAQRIHQDCSTSGTQRTAQWEKEYIRIVPLPVHKGTAQCHKEYIRLVPLQNKKGQHNDPKEYTRIVPRPVHKRTAQWHKEYLVLVYLVLQTQSLCPWARQQAACWVTHLLLGINSSIYCLHAWCSTTCCWYLANETTASQNMCPAAMQHIKFISLMWQYSMLNQHLPLTQQVTVSRRSKSVPHFSKASQWLMATLQFSCFFLFFFTNPSPVMHVFVVCVYALCAYKVYRSAHFIPLTCMCVHTRRHTHYNTTNTCITGNGFPNYPYSTILLLLAILLKQYNKVSLSHISAWWKYSKS